MARYGITTTWQELTGQRPIIAELHGRLAPYGLSSVFLGLARISAILKTFLNRQERARHQQITRQTLPRLYQRINALLEQNPDRVVITRTSILFVAKQALRVCPSTGPDATTPEAVEQIMTCCLMANDLLLSVPTTPEDATIRKAASMLTFSTYVPQDSFLMDLGRNLLLINEIAPQLAHRPDYIDLRAAFTTGAGITPNQFCELVFCAGTKFINYVDEQARTQGFILDKAYFQHTAIPEPAIDAFLGMHTTTLAALQQRVQAQPGLDNDFRPFQDRPLLEFAPGAYLCIDPGFLLEKAGKAFYWTLHATTPAARHVHLLGYWASVIDRYAQWHAQQTYQGTGRLLCSPRFTNGDEAADLLLLERDRALLFEVKAITLSVAAKYGTEPATLARELQQKAIEGTHGERKGVAQLRRNIERLLNGDTIPTVDFHGITKIYPILVFLDESFVGPYLPHLYREAFDARTLKPRGGPTITTLFAITLDDLQHVLPHTHRHQLADIFDDYYHHNRTQTGDLAFGSLTHAVIPVLQGTQPGNDPVRERFEQFAADLQRHAFPGTTIGRPT
jgi:hypothetical protein